MYSVLSSELLSLEGQLQRAAESLHAVWDDQQYSYFRSTYIEPVESALSYSISELELLLTHFNALTTQLDSLE